ncbi:MULTISPECIES: hypothetical protein [unclassified Janthinobacterium]|uniref:hypothetical protein n=1 Tax=unclassified Janthinobacterium TaxID=2610881 RepID=UPI001622F99D|nr:MULTISPECIES: hypothetical protein [unclassified Janthinobacterium]MBB5609447.1 hypothetical protein [Janthinobacterium sp. S3T4]MBB5614706.1 hypothetical protein [Janthinobacterium sp. S3M3]
MSRSADYTIQGFLYQFNTTLVEILKADSTSPVSIEGIIEDIEVVSAGTIKAIQCKYHETAEKFNASSVFKPLLQMLDHFHFKSNGKVEYILFSHYPNLKEADFKIGKDIILAALKSENKDFASYIARLNGVVDVDKFLLKFSAKLGPSYDIMVAEAVDLLKKEGISEVEVETLAYPNAIQQIASLSILHDETLRVITKAQMLDRLREIKTTAISQWTLSLKTKKMILEARRKQLKPNLAKNARLRYFLIDSNKILDFDDKIVLFIKDYLEKYHYKPTHISTPTFCLVVNEAQFNSIVVRLHQKAVIANDGYVANVFIEERFLRKPMAEKNDGTSNREFLLRILNWEQNGVVLNRRKGDDIFVISDHIFSSLDTEDVVVEKLGTDSFEELKFMMGLSDVYE